MSAAVHLRRGHVELCNVTPEDRFRLIEIRSTPEVTRWWRGDDLDAEFDQILAGEDPATTRLTIRFSGQIAGLVQFEEENDPEYRHASIDIYIDPELHRRGIATAAIDVVIEHLIVERGHHRVTIDPAADNLAAIACYQGVGFRRVGVMREYEQQADGRWADALLMELLASDRDNADVT